MKRVEITRDEIGIYRGQDTGEQHVVIERTRNPVYRTLDGSTVRARNGGVRDYYTSKGLHLNAPDPDDISKLQLVISEEIIEKIS